MRGAAVLLAAAAAVLAVWMLVPRAPVRRAGVPERVELLDAIPTGGGAAEARTPPLPSGPGAVIVHTNVPGAAVFLHFERLGAGPALPSLEAVANANGDAGFEIDPARRAGRGCEAEARAPGAIPARGRVSDGGEVWLRLARGFAVHGRVTDEAGAPVAHAHVAMHSGFTAVSGADGRFECGIPRPGRYRIVVAHERYVDTRIERHLEPGAELAIVLPRGLSVSGRITFPDGTPVPDAVVLTPSARARSDEAGRYTVSGLGPGPVRLHCAVAGRHREARAGATGVDFRVEHHVVRVRCVDEAGRPFFGADIGLAASRHQPGNGGAGGVLGLPRPPGTETSYPCPLRSHVVITAAAPGYRPFRAEHDLTGPARLIDYTAVLRQG